MSHAAEQLAQIAKESPATYVHLDDLFAGGAVEYPKRTWYIIVGFLGSATLLNMFSLFWAWHRRHALLRPAPATSRKTGNGKASIRRLPSAFLTASRIFWFRWRIPAIPASLLELSLAFLYIGILLLFTFIYQMGFRDITVVLWERRAGYLVTAQFLFIVALATKNNLIQFLTGISHEKLNVIHRSLGQATLILTWIHLWGVYVYKTDMFGDTWRWMGLLAGIAQTLLTILALDFVRKRFYEFFYVTHVILVLLFLIATYIHVAPFIFAGCGNYIWPCFLVWGLDRLCRYGRYLILSNFHAPNKSPAQLELVTPDTIRLSVKRQFPIPGVLSGWTAGEHMFLAFPTIGPIESHPFTMVSLPSDSITADGQSAKELELVWIIRVRNGFTRRLKNHILVKNKSKVINGAWTGILKSELPIFMDGPYGAPPDITPFETCVFVTGGSGISFTLPRMRDVLSRAATQSACVRRIVFVWAVRYSSHVDWVATELSKVVASAPPHVELSIAVHVTRPDEPKNQANWNTQKQLEEQSIGSVDEKDLEDAPHGKSLKTLGIKGVDIVMGRPNILEILEDAVTTASGPVSVDVSGPESLVESVRSALTAPFAGPMNVLRGNAPSVHLNVETFTI